jgi:hypothetical protein
MRRGRAIALSVLVLFGAAVLLYVLQHAARQSGAPRSSAARTTVQRGPPPTPPESAPVSAASSAQVTRTDDSSQSFNRRLRCTQVRFFLQRTASPEVVAALCDRKPLTALKIAVPLAEAGDPHAFNVLGFLSQGGSCDARTPLTAASREILVSLARRNGAVSETVQRLDALLAEEQSGPTPDELEACRQSVSELKKLRPGLLRQFTNTLGRSENTLRGENELDVEIEYERKMLVHGDVQGAENLATELLQKDTPATQAEAVTLLREAARTSPSAKTQLALCLLKGCPTPAPDPTEARQLLTDAALAGDYFALRTLAGSANPGDFDLDPNFPASERYAWGQFFQRLNQEGCLGSASYSTWATSGESLGRQNLLAMSPAESAAAQARAAALLAAQLNKTRALLGCD